MSKVFLNGFMGSGKSHWGRIWAEVSGLDFYDLDTEIETAEGLTVADIFEKKGESFFREKEKEMLRSFAGKDNFILSCGGGTPSLNDNMHWMNGQGITVYLQATPSFILEKVSGEINKRPLLKQANPAELLFFIEQKLKEREPFYAAAKMILPVEELNEMTIDDILKTNGKS